MLIMPHGDAVDHDVDGASAGHPGQLWSEQNHHDDSGGGHAQARYARRADRGQHVGDQHGRGLGAERTDENQNYGSHRQGEKLVHTL